MGVLVEQDIRWCVRRLPKIIRQSLIANNGSLFLAGGFIRSCISGEPVNDIDLFVGSPERAKELANELRGEEKLYETGNAYSFKVGGEFVQIIHRWTFSEPEACVQSFDFTIAKAAIWYADGEWQSCCHDRFYSDLAARRIAYTHPVREEEAGGSLLRLLKFTRNGYTAPLDTVAAVMCRVLNAVREGTPPEDRERVLVGLLKEVDPNAIDGESREVSE